MGSSTAQAEGEEKKVADAKLKAEYGHGTTHTNTVMFTAVRLKLRNEAASEISACKKKTGLKAKWQRTDEILLAQGMLDDWQNGSLVLKSSFMMQPYLRACVRSLGAGNLRQIVCDA